MWGGEGKECVLVWCEDLMGVQVTGGVGGDMGPVGVIGEWKFRCELF